MCGGWIGSLFSNPSKAVKEAGTLVTNPLHDIEVSHAGGAIGALPGILTLNPALAAAGAALGEGALSGGKPLQDLLAGGLAYGATELAGSDYLQNMLNPTTATTTGTGWTTAAGSQGIADTGTGSAVTTDVINSPASSMAAVAGTGAGTDAGVGAGVGAGAGAGAETAAPLTGLTNTVQLSKLLPTVQMPAADTGTSLSSLLSNPSAIPGAIGSYLAKNPTAAIGAAGLGLTALNMNRQPPGYNNLVGTAGQLSGQANQLESYLQNGTLPAGVQQSIDQATTSAIASIKSRYAAMGMSGSSAEAEDIANANAAATSQGVTLALNMLQSGINESGLASNLYQDIMQAAMQKDQNLQQALTGFAQALTPANSSTSK